MSRALLRPYIWLVGAAGAAVIGHSLAQLPYTPHPLEWFLFAALAVATGSFAIRIASIAAAISVSDTFFITSALLFGPAPATVAIAIDSAVVSWRRGHRWERVAFNAVAPAVSIWVAAKCFFLIADVQPLSLASATPIAPLILPLVYLTIIYFALNSGLMAIAVGLEASRSPFEVWRRHFLWLSVGYLAGASVAFCVVVLIDRVGLGAVALILPVLAVFHLTLRATFGRLDDANKYVAKVDRLYLSTIETLAMAIDAKDDVTHNHIRRVQASVMALARALGVTDELELKALEAAALLHDTGKLAVPEHILNKPGGLTAAEFEKMKRHVDIGADILSLVEFPFPIVPIVRAHHESWDGSGYPRGLSGTEIPIGARILSVVDCFDALTSDRPYRRRLTDEAALDILRERRGRAYDPEIVDKFIAIYKTIVVANVDAPEHRHVMQQIRRTNQADESPITSGSASPAAPVAASDDMLAFVSLARIVSGDCTLADVFALSSSLILDIVPGATAAWYVPDPGSDQLVLAGAFGPAAQSLKGLRMDVGYRVTGWVAAHRQMITNSLAALDIGDRAQLLKPALASCLSAPIMMGDTFVGVLTLYSSQPAFDEATGRMVQMVTPHIARAIHATAQSSLAKEPSGPSDKPHISARDLRLVSNR
jgi:putative nucleotidyltransferase with HDIG domain